MPAALDVDRATVEMNVRQYGVRETARMMALNENTVLAWANRGNWLGNIPRSQPLPLSVLQPAINAISGPKAQENAMREDSTQGRATVLRVARRAVARVERCDDDELIMPEIAGVLHQHTKTLGIAGGWNAQSTIARVALTVTAGHAVDNQEQKAVTLDAEWGDVDAPQSVEEEPFMF